MEVNDFQKSVINREEASDNPKSNNVNVTDLDEETKSKLRGDAIGDTLYSQSFVLKTLLQFSDLKWSEEVEEDLCFLWDMTVEKDVCKYLFELSFPSLACSAIMKYSENRFIEIIIGILANILCSDCDRNITEEEINIVLKELNTDDPLILIQLARFISIIVHISEGIPFISEEVLNRIKFILYNSTNSDLLLKTLEAVTKLTTDYKLDRTLIDIEIFNSSLAAYQSITNGNADGFELDTRNKQLMCRYTLEIVNNICAYIVQYENDELLLELKKCSDIFIKEVNKILNYFSQVENLLPVTDEFIFYMSVFRFILEMLNVNYTSDLFLPLTKILHIISEIKDEIIELFESVLSLECFLLCRSTPELLYKDLQCLPRNKIRKTLKIINENKHEFELNLDIQHLLDKYK